MNRKLISMLRKMGLIGIANSCLNMILGLKKSIYRVFGKNDLEAVYDESFFKDIDVQTMPSARAVVDVLYSEFRPKTVIDIGCGTGVYLSFFKKKDIKVFGVDGAPSVLKNLKIGNNEIIIKDLRKEFKASIRYDLCMCFELAEHIETKHSKRLVETLTSCSDTVVMTAAPPGQGGTDHINEQKRSFWIRLFDQSGFNYEKELTSKLAKDLKAKKVVWYIPKNLLVFKK